MCSGVGHVGFELDADMIVVVEQHNLRAHADLIEQMFRLRKRVFQDKLSWDVQVIDGLERDVYDDEAPVYVLYQDPDSARLLGSLRLLPTTGPTLLGDVFSDTLPDAISLSAPSIWECTRFCVEANGGFADFQTVSCALIEAVGELALRSGIETIVGNFDAAMLRVYRRIGCDVEVVGLTRRFKRPVYLGLFPVSGEVVQKIRVQKAQMRSRNPSYTEAARLVA